MKRLLLVLLSCICLSFASLQAEANYNPGWTTPLAPFQIADNLYYVGSPKGYAETVKDAKTSFDETIVAAQARK